MSAHPFDTELALHAAGDLSGWEGFKTALHVRNCIDCRKRVEAFRLDRKRLADSANDLPPGVNWDRLAAEMTANIHVGLAAGECVSSPGRRSSRSEEWSFLHGWNWKPVVAAAGLVIVFSAAWWLNLSGDNAALGKVWDRIVSREESVAPGAERGPVVAASSEGIEFRENGSRMGVSTGTTQPESVSVSFGGSASAQYVDDDTGQVTIATVYVQ
jgi:hypothetical protein